MYSTEVVCSPRSSNVVFKQNEECKLDSSFDALTIKDSNSQVIEFNLIKALKFVAQGSHAQVFRGTYNDELVAVKACRPDIPLDKGNKELLKEKQILEKLSHENVVSVYGHGSFVSKEVERIFVVYEFLSGGTLAQKIITAQRRIRIGQEPDFRYVDALKSAIMICQGMQFLHCNNLIHRDLKPENILFTDDGTLKIVDFALSSMSKDSKSPFKMTGNTGTLRYMAPEVGKCEAYNNTVDVYSFSIILWEMLNLKVAFRGMSLSAFKKHVLEDDQRPRLRSEWPDPLRSLLSRCWLKDFSMRPSFHEILNELETLFHSQDEC